MFVYEVTMYNVSHNLNKGYVCCKMNNETTDCFVRQTLHYNLFYGPTTNRAECIEALPAFKRFSFSKFLYFNTHRITYFIINPKRIYDSLIHILYQTVNGAWVATLPYSRILYLYDMKT